MISIREANVADAAMILRFVRELAIYEKAEHEVLATVESIVTNIVGGYTGVDALICEQSGDAIGFAVYFYNYSTWLGQPGLFLEDL